VEGAILVAGELSPDLSATLHTGSRRAPIPRLERVTGAIRSQIVSGSLIPGSKLRAEELAVELGVSPTPVREAFQRLAAEGLVTYSAQRGVWVTPVSREELLQLYELRCKLEPWALERSMLNMDEAGRTAVYLALDELESWYSGPSLNRTDSGYEEAHLAFHHALIAQCDSLWLIRTVEMLSTAAMRYRHLGSAVSVSVMRYEHEQLAKLATGESVELAVAAILAHLGATQLRALEALSHVARPDGPAA